MILSVLCKKNKLKNICALIFLCVKIMLGSHEKF